METLARICGADPDLLLATPFRVVDLTDKADQENGIQWWEERPSVNSPWDWKHWTDSYTKSPSGEFTNAFSACWR
jgi:hypothetical protein